MRRRRFTQRGGNHGPVHYVPGLFAAARAIACRKCNAAAGAECTSLDGSGRAVKHHKERVADALAILEARHEGAPL